MLKASLKGMEEEHVAVIHREGRTSRHEPWSNLIPGKPVTRQTLGTRAAGLESKATVLNDEGKKRRSSAA